MDIPGAEAGAVGFDEEAADGAVFLPVIAVGFGPDDGDVGDGAGGDPHFFAVEDVLIAAAVGAGAHAAGVGAEVGLGQAEAAELFAGGHFREPEVLLVIGAEGVDGIHDERGLDADEAAHAGVAALEFLHDEAVLDVGHAGAAVALEAGAEEAELAHLGNEFFGKAALAVALLDDGDEVVFDELAGGVAREALVVAEEAVEADEVYALERKSHKMRITPEGNHTGSGWEAGTGR